jgi:Haem-NO-binding
MRSFLCAEFLDFAGCRYGISVEVLGFPVCRQESCPGPDHVREWADRVGRQTGVPAGLLLRSFGVTLFGRLIRGYPAFLVGIESTVDLVARYEANIVAEVRKLNDAVRLPHISIRRLEGEPAEVIYRSTRGLADLAEGLLLGSVAHFGDAFEIERRETAGNGSEQAVFRLLPHGARS